jgi:hypothetical protein
MRKSILLVFLFLMLPTIALSVHDYTGTYISAPEFGHVTVVLKPDVTGQIQGTITGDGMKLRIKGALMPPAINGTVFGQGMKMNFMAQLQGSQLLFKLIELDEYGNPDYDAAETMILQRQEYSTSPAPVPPADKSRAASDRTVVINGTRLSNEQVNSLEQAYRVKIQEGAFWYDKTCGAWGLQGGPTAGFILPNLDLGGPLRADASNGTTGVFVNGRQLHTYDVLALQQLLGPVALGRYWLDAQGNVGIEGGPMLFNIVRIANTAPRRGGAGSTYRSNITGIGGGSSGGTSYVMGKDWAVMVGP